MYNICYIVSTAQYLQCCTVPHCTALYRTLLYCTVQRAAPLPCPRTMLLPRAANFFCGKSADSEPFVFALGWAGLGWAGRPMRPLYIVCANGSAHQPSPTQQLPGSKSGLGGGSN